MASLIFDFGFGDVGKTFPKGGGGETSWTDSGKVFCRLFIPPGLLINPIESAINQAWMKG